MLYPINHLLSYIIPLLPPPQHSGHQKHSRGDDIEKVTCIYKSYIADE